MINVDLLRYMRDRIWFGFYWAPAPLPYDPLALTEVFTWQHIPKGWQKTGDWRPWHFRRFRYY